MFLKNGKIEKEDNLFKKKGGAFQWDGSYPAKANRKWLF